MKIHKSAFLAIDELGCQTAKVIVVVNVVLFNGFDAFGSHLGLYLFNILLNNAHLIRFKRCTCIACHAAFAFATRQLAAKTGVEELVGYYNVVDYNQGAKIRKKFFSYSVNQLIS